MHGPHLALPESISFGYRRAGTSAFTSVTAVISNDGDEATAPTALSLSGDDASAFSLVETQVDALQPGASQTIHLDTTLAASGEERIVVAALQVADATERTVPIYAAIGDAALPDTIPFSQSRWADGATVGLPRAPYPGTNDYRSYVYFSLPPDFRKTAKTVDVILALHGHNGTVATTLPDKKYVEQAYASNRNAMLIVPQGTTIPDHDDFGAIRTGGGVKKLATEVAIILFREGLLTHPVLGNLAVSSHSGAYYSLSSILTQSGFSQGLRQAVLMDSLYGLVSAYEDWCKDEVGQLISTWTSGSTQTNSATLKSHLTTGAYSVKQMSDGRPSEDDLAGFANVFQQATSAHNELPSEYYNLALYWQLSTLQPKLAPTPLLRRALVSGSTVNVDYFDEPSLVPHRVVLETSSDGVTFTASAPQVVAGATGTISAAITGGTWVRLRGQTDGLGTSPPSDTYFVRGGSGTKVLVVDAFDRWLTGVFQQPSHDFSGRIGAALADDVAIDACANEMVERGACAMGSYAAVVLNTGLSAKLDQPMNSVMRALVSTYLSAGGKLLVDGAELAYALGLWSQTSYLSSTLKVASSTDDANTSTVNGAGALASLGTFTIGDGYAVDFPDTVSPASGATTLLTYAGTAGGAAIGNGHVVFVGFPLETIVDSGTRAAVVRGLFSTLVP